MAFDAGAIETTLDLDRTPFNQGLNKAEKDAKEFERKKFKAKVDVEIDQRQVDRDINRSTAGKRPKVEIEPEIDQAKVAKKIDEIADNTEKTAARSGNRIGRALLNPIMIQLGLLPGVAAVAAAGAGAALLAPVALFGLWGAAAAKSSVEVQESWQELKRSVTEGSREMSGPMRETLVDIMKEAKGTWLASKPIINGMFVDAAPHMRSFAGSLMGMTVNTLPGFNVALQRGEGFMRGWDGLLRRAGSGVSDLVDNATRMSSADTAMTQFGNTIQILLGFVGDLVAMFGDAWAAVGAEFNVTLENAVQLAKQFASGALPAMTGGLSMLLSILNAVMSVFGPLMNFMGSGVGTLLAAAAAYKLLTAAMNGIRSAGNTVRSAVTNSVQGLTNAGTAMTVVGGNAQKMSKQVDDAGKSQSKFAAMTAATGNVLGKVGASIPIIGAAFAIFGSVVSAVEDDIAKKIAERNKKWEEQRDIAERSADRVRQAQDNIAASTLQYNKALYELGPTSQITAGAQERLAVATLREKDAQKDAAEATKTHTERLLDFFETLAGAVSKQVGYNNAIKDVKEKQDALAESIKKTGKGSMDTKFATDELALAMVNQVKAAGDLAIANNAGKSSYDQMVAGQQATAFEAVKLINLFGDKAPAALYKTVAGMNASELAAIGGRVEFDKMGNAIVNIKDYKAIKIDSNMWNEAQAALTLKQRVDDLPVGTKYFNYIINTVATGAPDPSLNSLTGALRGRNASGTSYWRGGETWKDERGPELIQFPRGGKIFTNQRSQGMVREEVWKTMRDLGALGGSGDTYYNTFNPPPLADEQWLDDVANRVSQRQQIKVYQGR